MDGLLTDQDYAHMLLGDIDLDAQLLAIRATLARNREAEDALSREIAELAEAAKASTGEQNERLVDLWVDQNHHSVFQDAAHSTAAVGMIAPLIETTLVRLFSGIGARRWPLSSEKRSARAGDDPRFWNPQIHFAEDEARTNIVAGALQLFTATGLKAHLPTDTTKALEALFDYRNEMFHNGFEWPLEHRHRFWTRAKAQWPADWFLSATSGGQIWVVYMSDALILRCLSLHEDIMAAAGAFARRMSAEHGWNDPALTA